MRSRRDMERAQRADLARGEGMTERPYIDRYGHRHSAAVFENWSPAVLKALGVRRIKPESPEGGAA